MDEKLDNAEFEWDRGNVDKNWGKHKIKNYEAEEVFLNRPLTKRDEKHSSAENRYHCLGKTDSNKCLFISFTIRNKKIRIISARTASRKERKIYEN